MTKLQALLLEHHDIPVQRIAGMAGVRPSTVCRIKSGKTNDPRYSVAVAIIDAVTKLATKPAYCRDHRCVAAPGQLQLPV